MQKKPSIGGVGDRVRRARLDNDGGVFGPNSRCRAIGLSFALISAMTLAGCSSGDGGDNGVDEAPEPAGLVLTFPYDGQQDVTPNSQIVVKFDRALSGNVDDALSLQTDDGQTVPVQVSADADSDNDQAGIVTIVPEAELVPDTRYAIVARRGLDAGDTEIAEGQALSQFTTGPLAGQPGASDRLEVIQSTPGDTNPVTGRQSIVTEFSSIRVVFSEAVDASTVVLGESFRLTDDDGDEVPGRLTVIGHRLTFDPSEDLAPGSYTLALSNDITSAFGKSLEAYSQTKTVLSAGDTATENLTITPSADDIDELADNDLNGGPVNLVTITNQLIGQNRQPAMNIPALRGIQTTLAEPGMDGFNDVIPATIRGGQTFQLTPLSLRLNGDVPTPVTSGPIRVQFANDANVYLMANDLRNVASPTAVRLRFDLAISTIVEASTDQSTQLIQTLANGVFNQSVLNIEAAGLAIPQDNGDLKIDTLGTFALLVNRTDQATVDFELSLTLPGGDQTPVQDDQTPPYLTAQSPSACLYTFGTPAYDAAYAQYGTSATALPEQACLQILSQGGTLDTASGINHFPIEASPALIFSEPVEPSTVNANSIQLSYTAADGSSGNTPATFSVDGSSVVIDPGDALVPDAQYTITIGSGETITDLAGNGLIENPSGIGPGQTIQFNTEPLVDDRPAPAILGELTPGVPCALNRGDDDDSAGQCVGETDNDTARVLGLFDNPADGPINASFSKFVAKDSIVLADGCLSDGSGDTNDTDNATVALERIGDDGACVGTPAARIAFANRDSDATRGFTIRPVRNLRADSRYQIVVCGTESSACSSTIVDSDGFALNTNPLSGTASTNVNNADQVSGGPDIRVPFRVTPATGDYYTDLFTLPAADSNGNGQLDDRDGNGVYTPGQGEERPQPSNRTLIELSLLGTPIANANRADGLYPAYLSLTRPIAIRETQTNCQATSSITDDDGNSVIGSTPEQCIPVSLLPGGFSALTGIGISQAETMPAVATSLVTPLQNAAQTQTPLAEVPTIGPLLSMRYSTAAEALAGIDQTLTQALGSLPPVNGDPINTGRVILRFPDLQDDDGNNAGNQAGYIVPECQGSLNGNAYDFAPCFVASLQLVANAPDGQGVTLDQQDLTVNVVGPVTFEQNGRLVISLRNANTFTLRASALGSLPTTASVAPANLTYQLVGSAAHGGRAYPQR